MVYTGVTKRTSSIADLEGFKTSAAGSWTSTRGIAAAVVKEKSMDNSDTNDRDTHHPVHLRNSCTHLGVGGGIQEHEQSFENLVETLADMKRLNQVSCCVYRDSGMGYWK